MTVSAYDAAAYLCKISGWKVTNLELQKMLYMADMNFVGQTGDRLVDEDFEAWEYGPVLPSVYHECKAFGAKRIPNVFWFAEDIADSKEAVILERAYEYLRHQTAGQLVENTHWSGGAWAKKYSAGSRGIKILTQDMIDEYKRRREKSARRAA